MKLYFTNSSRQRKFLIESDYEEDLYDVVDEFFEEHHFTPHFLTKVVEDGETRIRFESTTEYFIIEGEESIGEDPIEASTGESSIGEDPLEEASAGESSIGEDSAGEDR